MFVYSSMLLLVVVVVDCGPGLSSLPVKEWTWTANTASFGYKASSPRTNGTRGARETGSMTRAMPWAYSVWSAECGSLLLAVADIVQLLSPGCVPVSYGVACQHITRATEYTTRVRVRIQRYYVCLSTA